MEHFDIHELLRLSLRMQNCGPVLCLGRLDFGDTSLCSPSHSPALELRKDQMQAQESVRTVKIPPSLCLCSFCLLASLRLDCLRLSQLSLLSPSVRSQGPCQTGSVLICLGRLTTEAPKTNRESPWEKEDSCLTSVRFLLLSGEHPPPRGSAASDCEGTGTDPALA